MIIKYSLPFNFSCFKRFFTFVFFVFNLTGFAQVDSTTVVTFDFNDHQIKERNNKLIPRYEELTLTFDRFGNERSAVYIHGNIASYLNLGTSELLKPRIGTISLWVNLDRRVYSGKGYDSNPIIATKNGEGDDFVLAYCIIYDCYAKKLLTCSSKDSLRESIIVAEDTFCFGKWYHLAITFDDHYMSFYINGKLQQKTRKDFKTNYLASDSVVLGHTASKKNERYSAGQFDDIQIYHRVLNTQEIINIFNAPNPNNFRNVLSEILKYGAIILLFSFLIILILIRNKWKLKKQKEEFELANRITELELKVVKAQMNPHFISNCLAAIQDLIFKNEVDDAGRYIAKFSFFLRQILNYSNKDLITLSEEIEMIKLNIELEQLRFKNEFSFSVSINEKILPKEILVPALITQPFIENAIWHGLLRLDGIRRPELKVSVRLENGLPIIEIEDNGIGRDLKKVTNEASKGTKLITDKIESLNKLYGTKNYKLQIIDLFNAEKLQIGTRIRIQLDLLRE
jgi:hypothetical protein